jgi:hypothetical protein
VLLIAAATACGENNVVTTQPTPTPTPTPTPPAPAAPTLTRPVPEGPAQNAQLNTLRPTLTVTNGTSDQLSGTRTYEFQISDNPSFVVSASFSQWFPVTTGGAGVAEGAGGKTSYTPSQDLQPTTLFYWRARMTQGSATTEWSETRRFKSKLVGYMRPGELYDPLIHGETVGTIVGSATWLPGTGIRLNDKFSYVKYHLPQVISNGEFSMDVEGLAANAPGDKAKVFGMQDGDGAVVDFITNMWRVDIQYRGTTGVPPNCIQWRAMFGSDDHKIEPSTDVRLASVYLLNPAITYHWKAVWGFGTGRGNGFRLSVYDGGLSGQLFYDQYAETSATYRPPDPYAYLGAPIGRSGAESATIAGAIYRNVWLSSNPRPTSLGSALDPDR